MDSIMFSYGKGKITCFLSGDGDTFIDVIPADMVVNAMVVAMAAHESQPTKSIIYHVSSSSRNILKNDDCFDYGYHYFSHYPLTNNRGKSIKVGKLKLLRTMPEFMNYVAMRYGLQLKVLYLVNVIFCNMYKDVYDDLNSKLKAMMRMVELYKPYLFMKVVFDDTNTENLRMETESNIINMEMFNFDPKSIDWGDYLINTHFPGILKHVVTRRRSQYNHN
ncbi:hypothetical protein ACFE04_010303 [Oxalis oulophora]